MCQPWIHDSIVIVGSCEFFILYMKKWNETRYNEKEISVAYSLWQQHFGLQSHILAQVVFVFK